MPDIDKQSSESSTEEWSLDSYRAKIIAKGSNHTIRKFINSAIYVEKPLSTAVSSESVAISQRYSNDDLQDLQTRTKRCTCSVDQKTCPCHGSQFVATSEVKKELHSVGKTPENKYKVSHSPMSAVTDEKDALIKNWIAKKEEEKKKKEMKEKMIQATKMKEREALLEKERNNFKTWLVNKKRMEMEAKKKKEKEQEQQQLKELEKEKRQLENQLSFQLWLKKKEEEQLEKKIQEHLKLINELEKKETHLKENEKAFKEWVKSSKNKQKPVPLNRGLETLCSSSSVTYINPNPWNAAP